MGNRAVITTKENWKNGGVGIYLHWNGGRDSVEAFLKYCELKGFRAPSDDCYGMARLCQVICNFFGGGLSCGIDTLCHLDCDNGDNGVYIIDGWNIVGRKYFECDEEQDAYPLNEMLIDIDNAQPEDEQIGKYLKAKEVAVEDIKAGDKVCFIDYNGRLQCHEIMGIGEDEIINGTNVKGIPYMDIYEYNGRYSGNLNNYIIRKNVRIM